VLTRQQLPEPEPALTQPTRYPSLGPPAARRATPHDRQVNAAHTRHAGQCAPSRLASLLIVQLAVPAFA
jgi:hypothetical protein